MKLIYRGISYDYAATKVANRLDVRATQPYTLFYRGATVAVAPTVRSQQPLVLPIVDLIYRGLVYSLNGWRGSQERATQPKLNAEAISAAAVVHRNNLYRNVQRRLQVATEQGNDALIHQLQQELNQIAQA